uniref:Uncharacterized protein n=1 Tax=candidate division WOR-3 bacterium TaxID=2052148 RepID=A0A7V0Z5Z5_UNCW3
MQIIKIAITSIILIAFWLGCGGDKEPPVVEITFPANGAMVGGTVTITAEAVDNKVVEKVELYIDNNLVSTLTSQPYAYSWNTTSLQDN